MTHETQDPELKRCIEACLACYQSCRETSMRHCLELGGKHVEPEHFRLMSTCAEICRTAADVMLSGSPQHGVVCSACAAICEACAKSCEAVGDMDDCVDACKRCAASCAAMSASTPTRGTSLPAHGSSAGH